MVMKTKLLLLPILIGLFLNIQSTDAQTLSPGDISIFWYQGDAPDKFAFTTYVDLNAGTQILFTDCGAVPGGTFDPAGCGEGAVVYTVPTGGNVIGDIIIYDDSNPAPEFANYGGDAVITSASGIGLSTGGDQITVIQGTGVSPSFIFMINASSTTFSGDDSASTTETNLFNGLIDTGLPRTALAVGSGPAPSTEWDNVMYTGGYTFSTVNDAKIALTNPANYVGVNAITDAPYAGLVAAIPAQITYTTLSNEEFSLDNSLALYPNPSNGIINIKNNGITLEAVSITDINGRTIKTVDLNGTKANASIDMSAELSSGLYFVSILSDVGSVTKKLIIE